ncbi:MAG: hypothetical protein HW400_902 [Candidatus Levybacteria bacterium]|nr:hypothetical protein [Candidatus Levybacteria bacterium]
MAPELGISPEKAKEIEDWAKKHKDYVPEGNGLVGLRHFDAMRVAGEPLIVSYKIDTSGDQDYLPDHKVFCGDTVVQELEAAGIVEFPKSPKSRKLPK